MRITIAQLNPTIGDFKGNLEKARHALKIASKDNSELLVLPELYLTGYPPRDLLERDWFIRQTADALNELCGISNTAPGVGIIAGYPRADSKGITYGLYNSAVLIVDGKVVFTQDKTLLPTYDVFDESRYFLPSVTPPDVVVYKGETIGISICEDAWAYEARNFGKVYTTDPISDLAARGATLIINISASPYYYGKEIVRNRIASSHAGKHGIPYVFVNQVGANDELIFDGRSLVCDSKGNLVYTGASFKEEIITIESSSDGDSKRVNSPGGIESVYNALVLGTGDYIRKCGFKKALIGLSGGIDSAITAAIAADAIGAGNVDGVTMPSPYSSPISADLSHELADSLGIGFRQISISEIYASYRDTLDAILGLEGKIDLSMENIQARIRGNILMAISNRYGHLVLSTGNKSELAVGYCTMYGDMSGGLAVLSDVPKTMVYELASYLNREGVRIPEGIINRPPSAELKPDQLDQDTLPPYEILDKILTLFIDDGLSASEIIEQGYSADTVRWVIRAVIRNEYKRRQAAPGLKVTSKAFGMGRRMPVASRYES